MDKDLGLRKHKTYLKANEVHLEDCGGKFEKLNSLQKCQAYKLNMNLIDLKYQAKRFQISSIDKGHVLALLFCTVSMMKEG